MFTGAARIILTSSARAAALLGLVWTSVLVLMLHLNLSSVARHTEAMMRQQAVSFFALMSASGSWQPEHPGDKRDAATTTGGSQTSANVVPAGDMIRQIAKREGSEGQIVFHIASLNARSRLTVPDAWEAASLSAFQRGSRERFEVNEKQQTFRYMAPLSGEPTCVRCHAEAGSRTGDIHGGISLTMPASRFLEGEGEEFRRTAITYGLIWMLGIGGLGVGSRQVISRQAAARAAERETRQSEDRFRRLFEEAPIAYHEIDADGIVQRINHAESELLGFDPAEMLGRPVWDFVAPEDREKSQEAVRAKVAGRQPLTPFSRDFVRRDGAHLILEIHENLIYDAQGAATGIRSALLDVTQRERVRRELARRTEELARSNEELEQFAYVASHDLQEPLRKLLAFGDRLKTRCAAVLDDQSRDYLERMQNASRRMQQLINDLLTLSRVKTRGHSPVPVDLAKVVGEVLSDLEVRVEQLGARVEVGRLPTISADPTQTAQLLMNLIGNALKFHDPNRPPVVRISGAECPRVDVHRHGAERWCEVRVEDNGIGFDEKYRDRIFQVFQRLHGRNVYEGTGIGLAVCKRIAERHGGNITATSCPGQGSTFIVSLPLAQGATKS